MKKMKVVVFCSCALACLFAQGKDVRVSSFGFDPEDSTRFIQAAIDSGADRVIFDKMPSAWVSRPIRGTSRQELFFEKGVELVAKRGEFLNKNDVLICWSNACDVVVSGYGAVLRMHKGDYVKAPYARSEWRHALSFRSCRGVKVEGLTIRNSGGDGIYLGKANGNPIRRCENVIIRDVECDGNHRQGLSVISVKNLLVERCRLNNTKGAPPEAGIDFEPNTHLESLSGIIVRDCEMIGNAGDGINLSLHKMRSSSKDVDIVIENCRLSGNCRAFAFSQIFEGYSCVGGSATIRNCELSNSRYSGIDFYRKFPGSVFVKFENCRLVNNCKAMQEAPDIFFSTKSRSAPPPWGVDFGRIEVVSSFERPPLGFMYAGWSTQAVEAVSGTIVHTTPSGTKQTVLDEKWISTFSPARKSGSVHKAINCERYEVVDPLPGEMMPVSKVGMRGRIEYIFYADKPLRCKFLGEFAKLRKRGVSSAVEVNVSSLRGGAVSQVSVPIDANEFSVDVPSAGFYRMSLTGARIAYTMAQSNVPVGIFFGDDNPQNIINTPCELFFYAGKGSDFSLYASGSPINERVSVELAKPNGDVLWCNNKLLYPESRRVECASGGLWSVKLSKPAIGAFEDYYVDLIGIDSVLFLTSKRYWKAPAAKCDP